MPDDELATLRNTVEAQSLEILRLHNVVAALRTGWDGEAPCFCTPVAGVVSCSDGTVRVLGHSARCEKARAAWLGLDGGR